MKKFITFIFLIFFTVSLASCNQSNKTTNQVNPSSNETNSAEITTKKQTKFTEEEINEATNCVKTKFKDFKGCTLKELWYDEEKSNHFIEIYFKNQNGELSNVKPENAIVLLSNFDVADPVAHSGLEPNSTYHDWNWILVRDSKTSNWKLVDWGY